MSDEVAAKASVRDAFFSRFGDALARRLKLAQGSLDDALRAGTDASAARAEWRWLRDLPDTITGETLEELLPQWPQDFPPLPEWFVDPVAAAAKDPPGEPFVVRCQPLPPEEEDGEASAEGEGETVPLDLQAAILARRAEKSIAEDALRATGTVPVAMNTGREVSAEDLGL